MILPASPLALQLPGVPSLVFLAWILLVLPWGAMRSRQQLAAMGEGAGAGGPAARMALWINTLIVLALLLGLSVFAGWSFGYDFLVLPPLTLSTLLATAGALAACFALLQVARTLRGDEERSRAMVYLFAPRTPRERAMSVATVLMAGVAEESAYRGVGMAVLGYALGDPWLPVLILAAAFAVAHAAQGWKGGVLVFVMALVMHALVQFTGSLLPAVTVHIVYDLAAGVLVAREARLLDAQAAPPGG